MKLELSTYEDLMNEIRRHDVISFDLFDTLIMRRTLTPEDVFSVMERRLQGNAAGRDFVRNRMTAILENEMSNPDLEHIYVQYCKNVGAAQETVADFVRLELETERHVLLQCHRMKKVFDCAVRMGKPVFLITDMYIPAAQLTPILQELGICGYRDLLVSCDQRTLKAEKLFSVFKQKYPAGSYLHIGDNLNSDVISAEKNNIDSIHLNSALVRFRRSVFAPLEQEAHTLAERCILGNFIASFFNDPFETHGTKTVLWQNAAEWLAAPLALCMTERVLQLAETGCYDKILFSARDGFLIQKLYNQADGTAKCRDLYFYTSRRAVSNLDLEDEHSILWLAHLPYAYKEQEIPQKVFLCPDFDYDSTISFDENLIKNQAELMDNSRRLGENYRKYLSKNSLNSGRLLFVDLVSSGTCQMYLERLTNAKIEGFYLLKIKTDEEGKEALRWQSLFPQEKQNPPRYAFYQIYNLLEYVLTSYEPSLLCFDEEGNPLFAEESRNTEEMAQLKDVHIEISQYFDDIVWMCGLQDMPRPQFVDAIIGGFLECAPALETSFSLKDDWMNRKIDFILPPRGTQEHIEENQKQKETLILGNLPAQDLLNEAERDAANYIQRGYSTDRILKEDARWEIFYHFSPMRQSLFNWYNFAPKSSLLELGCEMGALTGLFCNRCKTVVSIERNFQKAEATRLRHICFENLIVCAGDAACLPKEARFDYVVLLPAYYQNDLQQELYNAKARLNPGGTLLVCTENRMGADVLAGKTYTKEQPAYESLVKGSTGSCLRSDLKEWLRECGFSSVKFYYPMPDYLLPQEVYTDEKQPETVDAARILYYYPNKRGLRFSPEIFLEDSIKNDCFKAHANSFLVECRAEGNCSCISYAAMSTDRQRESAYATVIYEKKSVEKTALFPEGRLGIARLRENHAKLKAHNLYVLPLEATEAGQSVTMPYCAAQTLMHHLIQIRQDRSQIEQIFDRIYQDVLNASDEALSQQNALRPLAPDAEWGPICKQIYPDMIPYNIFWNEGKFVYFDQEFCKNNYPARYVMFRCLRYVDLTFTQRGYAFDLTYFQQRYGLGPLWKLFLQEEDRFIYENRNHATMKNFYKWNEKEIVYTDDSNSEHSEVLPPARWDEGALKVCLSDSFYAKETDDCGTWNWCHEDDAAIDLEYQGNEPRRYEFSFEIIMPEPTSHCQVEIYQDDLLWGKFCAPIHITVPLVFLKSEKRHFRIHGNFRKVTVPNDERTLCFQLRNCEAVREPRYVSDEVLQMRKVQKEMLAAFQSVCNTYGLHYYAFYGTLLGAVRHGGYIPWDDDIDIAMQRKDYEKLLHLNQKRNLFGKSLFLQNMYTEPDVFFGGYSKLRKIDATAEGRKDESLGNDHGVWLDILPLDACPDEPTLFAAHCRELYRIQRLMYQRVYKHPWLDTEPLPDDGAEWDALCHRLDGCLCSYNDLPHQKVSVLCRILKPENIAMFDCTCFLDVQELSFEDMQICAPMLCDEILKSTYGQQYMAYPPKEQRFPHHHL